MLRRSADTDPRQKTVRRLIFSLGTVLLAAAVTAVSGANFQATSANPSNFIKAGVVSLSNSESGTAALKIVKLAPGDPLTDTVDIVNTGDLDATFKLAASSLVDTPASPALSAKVGIKIEDTGDPACSSSCPATTTAYDGKLGSIGTVTFGSWDAGSKHRIKFTVTLADGGIGAENAYQGATSAMALTWTAQG